MFKNNPHMNDGTKAIYSHQPLTIEHYGIHAKIQENGKVLISSAGEMNPETKEIEFDEVEVPASLIFKLANLLKDTRIVKYVDVNKKAVE